MTLLEALGAGVPALGGHRSGGVPYVLDEGRQGWLCDVKDPSAMAEAILNIIVNGPPMPKTDAANYIDANFSLEAVTAQYLKWYNTILEKS